MRDGGRAVVVARLVEMVVVRVKNAALLGDEVVEASSHTFPTRQKRDAQGQTSPPRARTSALPSSLIQSSHTDGRQRPESLCAAHKTSTQPELLVFQRSGLQKSQQHADRVHRLQDGRHKVCIREEL